MRAQLKSQVRRLEKRVTPVPALCQTCRWPLRNGGASLILMNEETPIRCPDCDRILDRQGRPLADHPLIVSLHAPDRSDLPVLLRDEDDDAGPYTREAVWGRMRGATVP